LYAGTRFPAAGAASGVSAPLGRAATDAPRAGTRASRAECPKWEGWGWLTPVVIPPVAFLETLYRSEALAGLGLKPVEPRPANLTSGDF
jgi:hypothetical protein